MPITASDILHNADAYRAAHPEFGRPAEPAPEPEITVIIDPDYEWWSERADYDDGEGW